MARDAGSPSTGNGEPLLGDDDPLPVVQVNPDGASSFLLIGDHAGNRVPTSLAGLGVADSDRLRHIGWDIGIARLGRLLAETLDATFISQTYSRLVIDCNRDPARADAIPQVSDRTPIPGNVGLNPADRQARIDAIHAPYHAAISDALTRRLQSGHDTIVVALHSFTPLLAGGEPRPWHFGVLHHLGDTSFAHRVLALARCQPDLVVGDNEPYAMDGTDYTIPHHCYPSGRRYVETEIRQDLLASEAGCRAWSERMAALLRGAAAG
jgi:predicted N-formylglutamate amidohydrolase